MYPRAPNDKITVLFKNMGNRVTRGKILVLRKLHPKSTLFTDQERDRAAPAQRLPEAVRISLWVIEPFDAERMRRGYNAPNSAGRLAPQGVDANTGPGRRPGHARQASSRHG